jgi:hypothetical protein
MKTFFEMETLEPGSIVGYPDFETVARQHGDDLQGFISIAGPEAQEAAEVLRNYEPFLKRFSSDVRQLIREPKFFGRQQYQEYIEFSVCFGAYIGLLLSRPQICVPVLRREPGMHLEDYSINLAQSVRAYLTPRPVLNDLIKRNLDNPARIRSQRNTAYNVAGLVLMQCEADNYSKFVDAESASAFEGLDSWDGKTFPPNPPRDIA